MAKCGNKDYKFFIVTPSNRIESGWEYKSDANDHKKENLPPSSKARVLAKKTLERLGIDQRNCAVWTKGVSDLGRWERKDRWARKNRWGLGVPKNLGNKAGWRSPPTTLKDIVFETDRYWVKRVPKGFEVYEIGLTHSTRVASIGYTGAEGLQRAKLEIKRREKG